MPIVASHWLLLSRSRPMVAPNISESNKFVNKSESIFIYLTIILIIISKGSRLNLPQKVNLINNLTNLKFGES